MAYLHDNLIWIDPDYLEDKTKLQFTTPAAYVDWVQRIIFSIKCSEVGRIVLCAIKYHGHTVRISPLVRGDTGSASADWGDSQDLVFNRSLRPVLNAFGGNFPAVRAKIRFTPHHYAAGGIHHARYVKDKHDYTPSLESALLHELVHAFRAVSGKFDPDRLTRNALAKYDGDEEFFAILVENIYQSELKRNLRAHHQGFYNLDTQLAGSFEFYKASVQTFPLIDKFCRENPGLTRALGKIKTQFNPFAAYFKDSERARQLSLSTDAAFNDMTAVVFNEAKKILGR